MARNKSPEIDAAVRQVQRRADDTDQQDALPAELQRMIITEANSVPVIWYSRLVAHVLAA